MLIRRSVEHKVNMGNYEHVLVSATIEGEVPKSIASEQYIKFVNDQLQLAVADDLDKARQYTADDDSYIKEWK